MFRLRKLLGPPQTVQVSEGRVSLDRNQVWIDERRGTMTWAQRLTRVFGIAIETCSVCGGTMRIIACIEDAMVIEKILAHLDAHRARPVTASRRSAAPQPHRPSCQRQVNCTRAWNTRWCARRSSRAALVSTISAMTRR